MRHCCSGICIWLSRLISKAVQDRAEHRMLAKCIVHVVYAIIRDAVRDLQYTTNDLAQQKPSIHLRMLHC